MMQEKEGRSAGAIPWKRLEDRQSMQGQDWASLGCSLVIPNKRRAGSVYEHRCQPTGRCGTGDRVEFPF